MKDKIYPAIYSTPLKSTYLYSDKDNYCSLSFPTSGSWLKASDLDDTDNDTNITHEYLQNTYGEVVSPEHAEFIIELAELHGFVIGCSSSNPMVFEFSGDSINTYSIEPEVFAYNDESKQITIPLPPKSDKQEVSEWPQIGDDIVLMTGVCTVKSTADNHGVLAVTTKKGFNMLVHKSDIKKPKTPEEELRDEIVQLIEDADGFPKVLARALMCIYDITKKPK